MKEKQMAVCYDSQACIKCFACVVNCSVENRARLQRERGTGVEKTMMEKLPHLNYLTIEKSESGVFPDVKSVAALKHCQHCEYPKCMDICPAEAISKEDTGAVLINRDKCVGCQSCIDACPYDVPVFDRETGKTYKCIMCNDRLEAGLPTACAEACPSVAIFCGTASDVRAEAKERAERYEKVFGKKFIVYGAEPVNSHVGSLSYMTIAAEENADPYMLPENPKSGVSIARNVIKIGGAAAIGAAAAGIAVHVSHWKKHKEDSVYHHKDEE